MLLYLIGAEGFRGGLVSSESESSSTCMRLHLHVSLVWTMLIGLSPSKKDEPESPRACAAAAACTRYEPVSECAGMRMPCADARVPAWTSMLPCAVHEADLCIACRLPLLCCAPRVRWSERARDRRGACARVMQQCMRALCSATARSLQMCPQWCCRWHVRDCRYGRTARACRRGRGVRDRSA
jgi:hypothetical protein